MDEAGYGGPNYTRFCRNMFIFLVRFTLLVIINYILPMF
jgi:hypothetical protein